jgi:hypothetical protein
MVFLETNSPVIEPGPRERVDLAWMRCEVAHALNGNQDQGALRLRIDTFLEGLKRSGVVHTQEIGGVVEEIA